MIEGTSPRVTTTAPPVLTTTAPSDRCTPPPRASLASPPLTGPTTHTTVKLNSTQPTAPETTAPSRLARALMNLCRGSRRPRVKMPRWPPGRTKSPPGLEAPTALTSRGGWRRRGR